MRIKSDFYREIESEFKIISEKENMSSGGNPVNSLNNKLFYLSKRQFTSADDSDQALVTEIANTLQSLEEIIVKNALAYKELVKKIYDQNVDPQKWIDYAQNEARALSYEMYGDEVKYLRHFHIVWLTWVFCDEELKKIRIRTSREQYQHLGKVEKDYIKKRATQLTNDDDKNQKR